MKAAFTRKAPNQVKATVGLVQPRHISCKHSAAKHSVASTHGRSARKTIHETSPCGRSGAGLGPSRKMLGYPKFGFQLSLAYRARAGVQSAGYSPNHADEQDRDALPPWLVTFPWQRGQSAHVDDDVDEARPSGGFCFSPRYEARWRADEIMETPPGLICDAATSPLSPRCSHAMNQWTDDINEPEDVPAPHFCNTCGALHRGPVCRCMQLTIGHPITRSSSTKLHANWLL